MSVALRPLREEDSAQVLAWRNAPHVAAHMYTDHVVDPQEHARWLAGVLAAPWPGGDRRYWIILQDERPVGLANLVRIDTVNRRCDWAFYLGETDTRGQGVGAAVEYLVLREVFGPMGLNRLCCEVLVENESVWAMHAGFGFTREAHYRDHVWKAGRFHDVYGLAMLAADWTRERSGIEARLAAKGHDLSTLIVREV